MGPSDSSARSVRDRLPDIHGIRVAPYNFPGDYRRFFLRPVCWIKDSLPDLNRYLDRSFLQNLSLQSDNCARNRRLFFGAAGCVHNKLQETAAAGHLHDHYPDGFELGVIDERRQFL
jgi:hypothetical protein